MKRTRDSARIVVGYSCDVPPPHAIAVLCTRTDLAVLGMMSRTREGKVAPAVSLLCSEARNRVVAVMGFCHPTGGMYTCSGSWVMLSMTLSCMRSNPSCPESLLFCHLAPNDATLFPAARELPQHERLRQPGTSLIKACIGGAVGDHVQEPREVCSAPPGRPRVACRTATCGVLLLLLPLLL